MYGFSECWNCGEPPDTCVCIPWCYKHDRRDYDPRCRQCEIDRAGAEIERLRHKAERAARLQTRWRALCKLFGC